MKQYVIDELRPADAVKLKDYLDTYLQRAGVDGIYWLGLANELLNPIQADHAECGPFYLAVELTDQRLACELLVRAVNRIRCNCIGYATETQRNWLIQTIDAIFEMLKIIT
jgi:hypothetical protein